MPIYLTDEEIDRLVRLPKSAPRGYPELPKLHPRGPHLEGDYLTQAPSGEQFRLLARQLAINPADFSAILLYCPPDTNQQFRLRRYNGSSHIHRNKIEGNHFTRVCHIHYATARYQDLDRDEEDYAEPTTRYNSLSGAWRCLCEDCGLPPSDQLSLFAPDEPS